MVGIGQIALDIHDDSYITYYGDYVHYSQDSRSNAFKTTRLTGENNMKLKRITSAELGEYTGYVIYSKRSKIAVEWG